MTDFATETARDIETLEKDLRDLLGSSGFVTDEDTCELHSSDLLEAAGECRGVIRPTSKQDLSKAVAILSAANIPMAPRGGGLTYVRGYTMPKDGFVSVDLSRMNRILEINEQDMYITVEAGVTWREIYFALKPRGLRLPFFGTFSGRGATVGGGLSNGALFLGTARYGTAAEIAIGLQVVTADGSIVGTGQLAVKNASKPFFRTFGPDMTGVFIHDAGALGIKAEATLRLIKAPSVTEYLSFGFRDRAAVLEALSEIGRSEVAEEAYVMDPDKTKAALSTETNLARDAKVLAKVVRQERNILRGVKAGAKLVGAGREIVDEGCFSMHLVLSGRSRAAVEADMKRARKIASDHTGEELADSIPRATRADLFPSLDTSIVGAEADRWIALNAKVAHSDAAQLVDAVEGCIDAHMKEFKKHGVVVSRLLTIIGTHCFSYEPVFNWQDTWLPMHHATLSEDAKRKMKEPASNPEARELVMKVRQQIVDIFRELGAASNQIGRTYPYASILHPESAKLLAAVKSAVDPDRLINPGALEL
jgi:FAD/FMN-containing dehydrogenase